MDRRPRTIRCAVAVDARRRRTIGRPVGTLRWRENYPLQYEPLGHVTLRAGRHHFEIVRGGGGLLPGTGNEIGAEGTITRVGPIALVPRVPRPPVRVVGARAGEQACRAAGRLDWVEVVRPR